VFIDAHNHLQDKWLEPHVDAIAAALTRLPLQTAVVNGTHPDDWSRVAALARRFPWVRASYGIHPWHCGRRPTDWYEQLEARLTAEPTADLGEIGLDRWILDSARPDDRRLAGLPRAPLDHQLQVFVQQFRLAVRLGRTPTIHCLQAWGALLETLLPLPRPERGYLLHAYGGPAEMVTEWVRQGAYFSFSPSFLDPRKHRQREAFRVVPADRLLVETDAPAMPPPAEWVEHHLPAEPTTGTRLGHPADIRVTYAGLARLRGVTIEELQQQVADNFARLFR
jgi:TatD DNase family protein